MWECPNCFEMLDDRVDVCENCGKAKNVIRQDSTEDNGHASETVIENGNLTDSIYDDESDSFDDDYDEIVQTRIFDEITYSPSSINNYRTIKSVAFLFYVGAVISSAIGVLSLLGGITALGDYGNLGVFIAGFLFMIGMSISLIFVFLSESVNLILDIEANSRQTAKTLERILRSQRVD